MKKKEKFLILRKKITKIESVSATPVQNTASRIMKTTRTGIIRNILGPKMAATMTMITESSVRKVAALAITAETTSTTRGKCTLVSSPAFPRSADMPAAIELERNVHVTSPTAIQREKKCNLELI